MAFVNMHCIFTKALVQHIFSLTFYILIYMSLLLLTITLYLISIAYCLSFFIAHVCKNKSADQLCGNCTAISTFLFTTYMVTCTIFLLPKSDISSLLPSSLTLQPGLCCIWLETKNTDFLMTLLIWYTRDISRTFVSETQSMFLCHFNIG